MPVYLRRSNIGTAVLGCVSDCCCELTCPNVGCVIIRALMIFEVRMVWYVLSKVEACVFAVNCP